MFSISIILIALTVLISVVGFGQPNLFEKMLFRPYNIFHNKEYWRWFSGGFVHADFFHLAINMITMYFFASNLEYYFNEAFGANGFILFIILYLTAIPISSMYSYYKNKNNFNYSAVGASGAVSAVLYSCILFSPFAKIYVYFAIPIPAWLFGILYLLYEYFMGKKQQDNIGHDAHFFGAVYGLLFTIMAKPSIAIDFVNQFTN